MLVVFFGFSYCFSFLCGGVFCFCVFVCCFFFFFFFFQAEDGIRDRDVTGVQRVLFRSRAFRLPGSISRSWRGAITSPRFARGAWCSRRRASGSFASVSTPSRNWTIWRPLRTSSCSRSEERRVGKECRSRWSAYHEKQEE